MNKKLKRFLITTGIIGTVVTFNYGMSNKINKFFNDKIIEKPGYYLVSYPKGLFGHVEFTKYKDGSFEVLIYKGFGREAYSSKLYQDINGDGLVDRIRVNDVAWKYHKLNDLLIRDFDYETHKEEFDKADKVLEDLIKKYIK
ncbi:MAG: hypothetical protein PWP03_248 [Candidatus Woesearchaeota archaeon]|nr:hypothetical protein [Candidatus Woesearchaeota archaeon]MDN5327610.1 hypothetical protein [Candidatus Woesearchaeota archaeon]